MIIIGHRGARALCPENTIAALLEGSRYADYVEIDVRQSGDGVPVIMHDQTLDRTTDGTGAVSEYTLMDLKTIDAGEGEQIPTLAEVLALDLGNCGLVIELKEGGYEELVAAMVREAGLSRLLIVSFDAGCLKRIAPLLPSANIGYIFRSPDRDPIDVALSIPASYILPQFMAVTPDLVKAAGNAGLKVIAWTLNSEEEYGKALQFGVDGIAADDPSSARAFFDTLFLEE